jgi:hypothetical protein
VFFHLKCAHLMTAKAPLLKEAIFKRNQAAARGGELRAKCITRSRRS